MPIVKIDGKEVEVENGTNLIIAALKAGVYIPHYCYHPTLPVVAQCRMCLVKVQGAPKPVPACTITVEKDIEVDTRDEKVKKLREIVLELLLQHHPVDCPVCPRSGECDLQNFTYIWGPEKKRYDGKRRLKGWIRVSEKILLFKERCVLCTRCVRFLSSFTRTGGIDVTRRGFMSDLSIFPDRLASESGSNYVGNIIDLCPVGALVDEATVYLPRAWRVKRALTHCPLCERGCRIVVEAWKGKIVRVKTFDNMLDKAEEHLYSPHEIIQPAYNEIEGIQEIGEHSYDKLYTEDMLICDIGRWGWREFFFPRDTNIYILEGEKRKKVEWSEAKEVAERFLDLNPKAILLTPFATNEEMSAFLKLAKKSGADISMLPTIEGPEDEILIKRRKAPNHIGGERIIGGVKQDVLNGVNSGKYKALIFYRMGSQGTFNVKTADFVIYIDITPPRDSYIRGIFFPATIPYEKRGTYTYGGEQKSIYPVLEKSPSELDLANFLCS